MSRAPSLRGRSPSLFVGRAPSSSSPAEGTSDVERVPPFVRLSLASLVVAGSLRYRAEPRLVCALAAAVAHGAVWR